MERAKTLSRPIGGCPKCGSMKLVPVQTRVAYRCEDCGEETTWERLNLRAVACLR